MVLEHYSTCTLASYCWDVPCHTPVPAVYDPSPPNTAFLHFTHALPHTRHTLTHIPGG
jgi:hypothetical protein